VSKELVILHGDIQSPPFSVAARREAGYLIRELQDGNLLSMPHSRPMPNIGARVHELRIVDESVTWRIVYRIDSDAILIADVFRKQTSVTPNNIIEACKTRLAKYTSS
jgi:phage-related protein